MKVLFSLNFIILFVRNYGTKFYLTGLGLYGQKILYVPIKTIRKGYYIFNN